MFSLFKILQYPPVGFVRFKSRFPWNKLPGVNWQQLAVWKKEREKAIKWLKAPKLEAKAPDEPKDKSPSQARATDKPDVKLESKAIDKRDAKLEVKAKTKLDGEAPVTPHIKSYSLWNTLDSVNKLLWSPMTERRNRRRAKARAADEAKAAAKAKAEEEEASSLKVKTTVKSVAEQGTEKAVAGSALKLAAPAALATQAKPDTDPTMVKVKSTVKVIVLSVEPDPKLRAKAECPGDPCKASAPPPPPDPCQPCPPEPACCTPPREDSHPVLERIPDLPLTCEVVVVEPPPPPPAVKERECGNPLDTAVECPTRGLLGCGPQPWQQDLKDVTAKPRELRRAAEFRTARLTPRDDVTTNPFYGVPEEYREDRIAFIYQPTKNAMQSGTKNTNHWRVDFDTRQRWENPCMGWTSSGDSHSNLVVKFASLEDAKAFCQWHGYQGVVMPQGLPKRFKPSNYGEIFSWSKRTRSTTK